MGSTRRKFTVEFKTDAAHRVINTGRTLVDVAGELSVDKGPLARWAVTNAGAWRRWQVAETSPSPQQNEPSC